MGIRGGGGILKREPLIHLFCYFAAGYHRVVLCVHDFQTGNGQTEPVSVQTRISLT